MLPLRSVGCCNDGDVFYACLRQTYFLSKLLHVHSPAESIECT